MIRGMTVVLWKKTQAGADPFGHAIYVRTPIHVTNVLVGEPSGQERIDEKNLTGRSIDFVLGIPKGDENEWEDQIVEFFGHKFRTFGIPEVGIEENIPGPWHKKVKCERYE